MVFNKSLDLGDYQHIQEHVLTFNTLYNATPFLNNHQHRKWEYGLGLEAIKQFEDIDSLLDVGGGGGLLAPIAYRYGYDVTVIDPDINAINLVLEQNVRLLSKIKMINKDFLKWDTDERFDAVFAVSVIEHVENHFAFFDKLFSMANRLVYLTTDFSQTGERFSPDHLRTYTEGHLMNMADNLPEGWKLYGEFDWSWKGNYVFNYSFASLCAVKL